MVPLKSAFGSQIVSNEGLKGKLILIDLGIKFIFFIDILLSFRKAYLQNRNGQEVRDPKLIAIKYLKFYFWIDLLSAIPFDYIQDRSNLRMFGLLKIFRLFRMKKILSFMNLEIETRALIRIIQIIATFVIITHWATCYFFSMIEKSNLAPDGTEAEFHQDYWIPQVDLADNETDYYSMPAFR